MSLKLSSADYALLAMAKGSRPLSPYKVDQDALHRLWDADLIDVSWEAGTVRVTPDGDAAWAARSTASPGKIEKLGKRP